MEPALVASTRPVDEEQEVLAPGVGWWSAHPVVGSMLNGGARIGSFEVLGRRHVLRLPAGVSGVVCGELPTDRRVAVEYGQALFRLGGLPDSRELHADASTPQVDSGSAAVSAIAGWPVVAPTDGVFYRRPSPTDPPFVEVGSPVRAGQAVGLVESMKTFNQIVIDGEGCPAEGTVAEVVCEDGDEVTAGQVLMRIR